MNILLFGGSFNPPHLGHLKIIVETQKLLPQFNSIWLLPDYHHTFAKENLFAPAQHRLAMTKLLLKSLPADSVRVESCAIKQQMSGSTLEHLRFLQTKYPRYQFSFLMGSDQLPQFHHWSYYKNLLKVLPFYIYPRLGADHPITYPNMTLLKAPKIKISSTLIRAHLQKNQSINQLTTPEISDYIHQKHLYSKKFFKS